MCAHTERGLTPHNSHTKDYYFFKILNRTDITLPDEIREIVSFGVSHSLETTCNDVTLLREFEKLTKKWVAHAKATKIDEITM